MKNDHHKETPAQEPARPESQEPAQEAVDHEAEAAKFKDLALRATADLDNFRKRATREKEDAIRYANSALLEKLLPILDNFELGLEAAKSAPDAASIVQGMAMVEKQLKDFLVSHGVELIPAEGEVFDPNRHEAVAQEPSNDVPEGTIVRQMRKGYKLKDRILRASTVTVSKGAAE